GQSLTPPLAPGVRGGAPPLPAKSKGIQPEGLDEMVRTAASLEHLPALEKMELGGWIAGRLREAAAGPWAWSIGRIGARIPVYGSGHRTVPSGQAAEWIRLLIEL